MIDLEGPAVVLRRQTQPPTVRLEHGRLELEDIGAVITGPAPVENAFLGDSLGPYEGEVQRGFGDPSLIGQSVKLAEFGDKVTLLIREAASRSNCRGNETAKIELPRSSGSREGAGPVPRTRNGGAAGRKAVRQIGRDY